MYARYVYVLVCVCLRALGRPLECDSRPAQWQETPWRLWQAASCTPSFRFLSHTPFSLCAVHPSPRTSLHSLSSICIHSIHIVLVFLFFPFHSSSLHFLSGSQRDLNNWTFLTFFWYFLCQSTDKSFFFCLCFSVLLFFSFIFTMYFMPLLWRQVPLIWPIWVFVTWLSRHWSLNPIFSLLIAPSRHSKDLLNSQGRELYLPDENRTELSWSIPTSQASTHMGTHIYIPPRAYLWFNANISLGCAAAWRLSFLYAILPIPDMYRYKIQL